MIYIVMMWINAGINQNGINQVYSSRENITGKTLAFKLQRKAYVGAYVHIQIYPDKTNGIQNHTLPGIYLGSTVDM